MTDWQSILRKHRDRNIAILAAVVGIAAAAAGITGGIAEKDYSIGQQKQTQAGQDEQVVVLSMLAYDQGHIDTATFLLGVFPDHPNGTYTKDAAIAYYANSTVPLFTVANNTLLEGDSYRSVSDILIALAATLSAGIVAYAEITRPK